MPWQTKIGNGNLNEFAMEKKLSVIILAGMVFNSLNSRGNRSIKNDSKALYRAPAADSQL